MKTNIKSLLSAVLLCMATSTSMNGQEIIKLWKDAPPTDNKLEKSEEWQRENTWVVNVSSPELHIYKPKNPNGVAVVICPGGGYAGLAMTYEGWDIAEWLNTKGITALVLKYRMPNKHTAVPLEDGQQAMRYVRENAKELGINPNKVGILGSSAGGHLASTISTHYATEGTSTRPDFSILFYPVITMKEDTHKGSKNNLLGDSPKLTDIHRFSNEEQVTVNTPPTLLLLSDDDKTVPPSNSDAYYSALKKNNVPAAMYIFPTGGHGWGFKKDFKYHEEMKTLLSRWLDEVVID